MRRYLPASLASWFASIAGAMISAAMLWADGAGTPLIQVKPTPEVLASSHLFGFPIALFGFIMFASLIFLNMWATRLAALFAALLTAGGCGFVVYLIRLSIRIHAFCNLCVFVWICTLAAFISSLMWLFRREESDAREG